MQIPLGSCAVMPYGYGWDNWGGSAAKVAADPPAFHRALLMRSRPAAPPYGGFLLWCGRLKRISYVSRSI